MAGYYITGNGIFGLPLFVFLDPMALFNGFFTGFAGGFSAVSAASAASMVYLHYTGFTPVLSGYIVFKTMSQEDFRGIFDIRLRLSRLFPVIKGST